MSGTTTMSNPTSLMEKRFRDAIEAVNREGIGALDGLVELYDPYVVFQDPLQTVYGRDELAESNRKLIERSRDLYMSVATFVESDDHLFATWTMSFSPRFGPRVTIEGCTHGQLRDGLITYQRDYWDLLGSFMETLPAVGLLYRRLTGLLA
ncbi:MAG: nuclear transport factor 2 family protein [Myxococcota bacterium]